MGININAKSDYSFMFSSLGSGAAGVGSSNFLMDYASIKNGSYGKLMKAYYRSEQASGSAGGQKTGSNNIIDKLLEEKRNPKVSKEVQEANTKLTSGLSNLKSSVSALQNENTFTDTANGKSAVDHGFVKSKGPVGIDLDADLRKFIRVGGGTAHHVCHICRFMGQRGAFGRIYNIIVIRHICF